MFGLAYIVCVFKYYSEIFLREMEYYLRNSPISKILQKPQQRFGIAGHILAEKSLTEICAMMTIRVLNILT